MNTMQKDEQNASKTRQRPTARVYVLSRALTTYCEVLCVDFVNRFIRKMPLKIKKPLNRYRLGVPSFVRD